MKQKWKGGLLLFAAALIWGNSFVAQTTAAASLGSFTFNACRSFAAVGFLIVLLFCSLFDRKLQYVGYDPGVRIHAVYRYFCSYCLRRCRISKRKMKQKRKQNLESVK